MSKHFPLHYFIQPFWNKNSIVSLIRHHSCATQYAALWTLIQTSTKPPDLYHRRDSRCRSPSASKLAQAIRVFVCVLYGKIARPLLVSVDGLFMEFLQCLSEYLMPYQWEICVYCIEAAKLFGLEAVVGFFNQPLGTLLLFRTKTTQNCRFLP